jgi:hypothetical protein
MPGTSIGENPGLINGLMGGPSGDQQMLSFPITFWNDTLLTPAEQGCRRQFDQDWICHPAIPAAITSQQSRRWKKGNNPRESLNHLPILLNSGVTPHRRIHRCGDQNRHLSCQKHAGQ